MRELFFFLACYLLMVWGLVVASLQVEYNWGFDPSSRPKFYMVVPLMDMHSLLKVK